MAEFGEDYHKESIPIGMADENLALFDARCTWVQVDPGQWILEYGTRFVEENSVLLAVRIGLGFVPEKTQEHRDRFRSGQGRVTIE